MEPTGLVVQLIYTMHPFDFAYNSMITNFKSIASFFVDSFVAVFLFVVLSVLFVQCGVISKNHIIDVCRSLICDCVHPENLLCVCGFSFYFHCSLFTAV